MPVLPTRAAPGAKRPWDGAPSGLTTDRKKFVDWTADDVATWLGQLELSHLAPSFLDSAVDGALLSELTQEELVSELGLTKLQARKVKGRQPA